MNHYRYHILILLFLSYLLLSATLKAAVPIYGIPEVDYFSRGDYKGATQNWSISQAENGLLYSANNDGILEYDGSEWRLLPKNANVIHRSVLAYQNRIYMGAYNEFGYYEYNGHKDIFPTVKRSFTFMLSNGLKIELIFTLIKIKSLHSLIVGRVLKNGPLISVFI